MTIVNPQPISCISIIHQTCLLYLPWLGSRPIYTRVIITLIYIVNIGNLLTWYKCFGTGYGLIRPDPGVMVGSVFILTFILWEKRLLWGWIRIRVVFQGSNLGRVFFEIGFGLGSFFRGSDLGPGFLRGWDSYPVFSRMGSFLWSDLDPNSVFSIVSSGSKTLLWIIVTLIITNGNSGTMVQRIPMRKSGLNLQQNKVSIINELCVKSALISIN